MEKVITTVSSPTIWQREAHRDHYSVRSLCALDTIGTDALMSHHLPVALALREQLVDKVPTAAHDWIVDMIVTPDEVLTRSDLEVISHGVVWKP